MRKEMGHTAFCYFATFNRIVDIKTSIVLTLQSQIYKTLLGTSKKLYFNRFLRIPSLIPKDEQENF